MVRVRTYHYFLNEYLTNTNKKPSDPTIAEKFNTHRFAAYKEHVIDLLKRVCMVSVVTMKVWEKLKIKTKRWLKFLTDLR